VRLVIDGGDGQVDADDAGRGGDVEVAPDRAGPPVQDGHPGGADRVDVDERAPEAVGAAGGDVDPGPVEPEAGVEGHVVGQEDRRVRVLNVEDLHLRQVGKLADDHLGVVIVVRVEGRVLRRVDVRSRQADPAGVPVLERLELADL